MAFHSAFSKMKLKFKMWFLINLYQILISTTPWTRKRVKNMKKSNWHLNWYLDSSNFWKIQGRVFWSRRTRYLKGRFGRDRPMKNCIATNGRDEASVDQIIAIKSESFDRRWRAEVSPSVLIWNIASLDHPLDLNPTIAICWRVQLSRVIFAIITREINGRDEFT